MTLKGPHAGPAGIGGGNSEDARLIASLSGLFAGSGKETSSLGTMRAAVKRAPPNDPWVINIEVHGDHCVPAKGPVKLWRANSKKARILILKNLGDKTKAKADWPTGGQHPDLAFPGDSQGRRLLSSSAEELENGEKANFASGSRKYSNRRPTAWHGWQTTDVRNRRKLLLARLR